MKFFRIFQLSVISCFLLSSSFLIGCASKQEDLTKKDREKISTIPHNRPQSWEGQGVLGGMVQ